MIYDVRVVQDHGWIQQPDGTLAWGPTRFWMESLGDDGQWAPLKVHMINEQPRTDDPLYEPSDNGLGSEETLAHRTRMTLS
jgi:hypothetical protein